MKFRITALLALTVCFCGYANIAILNGLKHEYNVQPGGIAEGEIVVKNVSDSPQQILLYLQDMLIVCGQSPVFTTAGSSPTSLHSWITLLDKDLILEPGETRNLTYTVKIPQNANASSFWSTIMVEGVTPISRQNIQEQVSINSKIRYGVQIICSVGHGSRATLTIDNAEYLVTDNSINIKLSNASVFVEKSVVSIEVYNADNVLILKKDARKENVYPKSCKTISVPLDTLLEKGNYTCLIILDSGTELLGTSFDFQHL